MVSILDIYDELPEDEKEIITEHVLFLIRENKESKTAIKSIPEAFRKYFSLEFGLGIGNKEGQFIGLACKSCNAFHPRHSEDCPIQELMNAIPQS